MPLSRENDVRTLADLALAELREAIISGRLAPGTPIRLRQMVEELSMSGVPIREAMRFLEQKGLIDRVPHRGVVVAPMSAQDLEDTYRIRLELESMAVRGASAVITEADRERLLRLVGEYGKASTSGEQELAWDLHGKIHMSLYHLAGSKWLSLILPMLWDNSERYRRLAMPRRGTPEERIEEHRVLVETCATGDPDAAEKELRAHLSRTLEAAIALLREEEAAATRPRPESPGGPR